MSMIVRCSLRGLARQRRLLLEMAKPSSDSAAFKKRLADSNYVVVLTGAGVSAESGIPTFRGAGGFWRTYVAQDLASPSAFARDPSLVWEFYHYRREVVLSKKPNPAHFALAEAEKKLKATGKKLIVITQNIDELHRDAGTEELLELHGSLFKVRCVDCGVVESNRDSPICEALRGRGAPDPKASSAAIPLEQLPRCPSCSGLLRPHVVWFGETLDPLVLMAASQHLESCDLCLVVGTSSVVYPAAMFAPKVAARGVPVAEFNLESTPATHHFGFHFCGPASETVPEALSDL